MKRNADLIELLLQNYLFCSPRNNIIGKIRMNSLHRLFYELRHRVASGKNNHHVGQFPVWFELIPPDTYLLS